MPQMNTHLIVNPNAGAGKASGNWQALIDLAEREGIEVRQTKEAGEAEALAREAVTDGGADVVVAAGGDGTISEVINGLSADFEAARLVIVPMGTANDFANTLGVPLGDVAAALALAKTGREHRVDLVCSRSEERGERYIINASTGGFSEVVHHHLDADLKRRWGPLAYLRAAVGAVPDICFHNARLDIDGEELVVDTCAVVVGNGRSAGGFALVPQADVEDERLDLLIIRTQTYFDELRLASRFVVGSHLESEDVDFRQSKRVHIQTEPPMKFSSDGELIGTTPIQFEVVPRVLRVMLPVPEPRP